MQKLKLTALAVLILASLCAISVQAETAVTPASAIEIDALEVAAPEIDVTESTLTEATSEILEPTALEIELGIVIGPGPNPCYQFDNPAIGCYRTWSPQTLCCLSNNKPGCFDICY